MMIVMQKMLTTVWIVIFLGLFSLNAYADSPSYNFISIEYADRSIDDVGIGPFPGISQDISFNGLSFVGSIEINDKWFAEIRYLQMSADRTELSNITSPVSAFISAPIGAVTGSSIIDIESEATLSSTSVGYQIHQDENSSLFIALGFAHTEVDTIIYGETVFRDASGNIVPQLPGTWLPSSMPNSYSDSGALVSAGYHSNLGNSIEFGVRIESEFLDDTSTSVSAELLYKFMKTSALQIGTELADDETQFSIGLRYMY